ncbi:hypothetical protein [Brevibacillus dissolubilis]|uniref:hypothetical protein n=1 Tax=Brevibacillus dissolubilis TaxID=1844116 RepID=UPI001115E77D|nr:hypothetical protein [Brevibacillus dissolubilis]
MNMKKWLLPALLSVSLLGSTSGLTVDASAAQAETPSQSEANVIEVEKDGLRFTTTLHGEEYPAHLNYQVEEKVTNISGKEISYTYACSPISIRMENDKGIHLLTNEMQTPCPPVIEYAKLAPGESVSRTETFYPVTMHGSGETNLSIAPLGTYQITAGLTLDIDGESKWVEVKPASVKRVEGQPMLTPQQAEALAKLQPAVSRWMYAHTGVRIAKVTKGKYYVYRNGKWTETDKKSYEEALAQPYYPSFAYQDGKWQVQLYSSYGREPNQISADIQAAQTQILENGSVKVSKTSLGDGYFEYKVSGKVKEKADKTKVYIRIGSAKKPVKISTDGTFQLTFSMKERTVTYDVVYVEASQQGGGKQVYPVLL